MGITMELSKHAQVRMIQRGITNEMVDILLNFGITQFHQGYEIFSVNKRSLKKLCQSNISSSLIEKIKALYVVYNPNNNCIVTAAYRYNRIKKDRKKFQHEKRKSRCWRNS